MKQSTASASTHVDLSSKEISSLDLTGFACSAKERSTLERVSSMNVSCNNLREIPKELAIFLPRLKSLTASRNLLSTQLVLPRTLVSLDLSHNQLVSITELVVLQSLERLDISFNRIMSFGVLRRIVNPFPRLIELRTSNNWIKSLRGIECLIPLQIIDASHNNINFPEDYVAPLEELPNLKEVYLQGNPVVSRNSQQQQQQEEEEGEEAEQENYNNSRKKKKNTKKKTSSRTSSANSSFSSSSSSCYSSSSSSRGSNYLARKFNEPEEEAETEEDYDENEQEEEQEQQELHQHEQEHAQKIPPQRQLFNNNNNNNNNNSYSSRKQQYQQQQQQQQQQSQNFQRHQPRQVRPLSQHQDVNNNNAVVVVRSKKQVHNNDDDNNDHNVNDDGGGNDEKKKKLQDAFVLLNFEQKANEELRNEVLQLKQQLKNSRNLNSSSSQSSRGLRVENEKLKHQISQLEQQVNKERIDRHAMKQRYEDKLLKVTTEHRRVTGAQEAEIQELRLEIAALYQTHQHQHQHQEEDQEVVERNHHRQKKKQQQHHHHHHHQNNRLPPASLMTTKSQDISTISGASQEEEQEEEYFDQEEGNNYQDSDQYPTRATSIQNPTMTTSNTSSNNKNNDNVSATNFANQLKKWIATEVRN